MGCPVPQAACSGAVKASQPYAQQVCWPPWETDAGQSDEQTVKVLLDSRPASDPGGVGRYSRCLLAALRDKGLSVPQPIAARYRRDDIRYRADILTRRIANAATLAELLGQAKSDVSTFARVGAAIAKFHAQGAYHADLNAHNVLLTPVDVWLIDFDRGELRSPQRGWQLDNLSRLRRSLVKVGAARNGEATFEREIWQPLMQAYDKSLAADGASRVVSNAVGQSDLQGMLRADTDKR